MPPKVSSKGAKKAGKAKAARAAGDKKKKKKRKESYAIYIYKVLMFIVQIGVAKSNFDRITAL